MFPIRFQSSIVDLGPWKIREFRGGEGAPLVLLHGLSGSFDWWSRNRESLAAEHLVLAVDLLGFGSERRLVASPLPLGIEESTELLRMWIERRAPGPVHLVGHSMGGQLAVHLAATHPALVRSLVLVSSSGIPVDLRPGPHIRAVMRPPGGLLSFLPVLARDAFRAGPTSIALALARLLRDDVRPLLGQIGMPTLLVWGDNDPFVPVWYAEQFEEAIPNARLQLLADAGHVPMWDQPDAFNAAVLDHLGSVERGERRAAAPRQFRWAVQDCHGSICHRASGAGRDVVLLHGLGIRSGYFRGLARELHDRGLDSVAPDLPGFGYSQDAGVGELDDAVAHLVRWADRVAVRGAVWLGHSTGAQMVERIMRIRPDLVSRGVFVSPIWNREPLSTLWLAQGIVRDAPKESPHLVVAALQAYWEAGVIRFYRAFRRYAEDAGRVSALPPSSIIAYGEDDPLVQREHLASLGAPVREIAGAHGVVFTHPAEVAALV